MALMQALAQDADFVLVSVAPDVCFTPNKPPQGAPVPYPITHKLDQSKKVSTNVFIHSKGVYLHQMSYVDNVMGDQPGMGKGVVSQTNVKISHNIAKSGTVFANGHAIVRGGDAAWMNWSKK